MDKIGRKEVILSDFFSGEELSRVMSYIEHLQSILFEYDYIVFMARKAICFFEALVRNGEISLAERKSKITSNRIFTYSIDKINGKKIILIDDILITGKTLGNSIKELQAFTFDFKVYYLAGNKNTKPLEKISRSQLVSEPLLLSETDILSLSNNITRYIEASMCPYNIDFPVFSSSVTDEEFLTIKKKFSCYNIQNAFQNSFDIDISVQSIMGEDLGLFESIDTDRMVLKIRLFYDRRKKHSNLFLMPVVLFDKLKKREINTLFGACSNDGIKKMVSDRVYCYQNKFKWIQFFLSYKLFYAILEKTDFLLKEEVMYALERQYWIFPEQYNRAISKCLNKEALLDVRIDTENVSIFDMASVYAWFLDYLQGAHEENEGHCENIIFEELVETFSTSKGMDAKFARKIFSNVFDISIDKGLIVPNTLEDKGYIFRAYHLSEQYKLLDKHYDLFVYMLSAYRNNINRRLEVAQQTDVLGKIIVEKLLVLFFKKVITSIAEGEKKFGPDLYNIHYTRFGPIVSTGANRYEVDDGELTDKITSNEYHLRFKRLNFDSKIYGYHIPPLSEFENTSWGQQASTFSLNYATLSYIFEQVREKSNRIKSFGKYLTLKAIGEKKEDQYLSLLAELRLFRNKYPQGRTPFEGLIDVVTGLISGAWKFICYSEKSLEQINNEMKKYVKESNDYITELQANIIRLNSAFEQEDKIEKKLDLMQKVRSFEHKRTELELLRESSYYVFNYDFNDEQDVITDELKIYYSNRMKDVVKLICELLQYWNIVKEKYSSELAEFKRRNQSRSRRREGLEYSDILGNNKNEIETLKKLTGCESIDVDSEDHLKKRLNEICEETDYYVAEYDKCLKGKILPKYIETVVVIKHINNNNLNMLHLSDMKRCGSGIEKNLGVTSEDKFLCAGDLKEIASYWPEIRDCSNIAVYFFKLSKMQNRYYFNTAQELVHEKFKIIYQQALNELEGKRGFFMIEDQNMAVSSTQEYKASLLDKKEADKIVQELNDNNTMDEDESDIIFGIITALPKEFAAVKVLLNNCHPSTKSDNYTNAGERFYVGEVNSNEGGGAHKVALGLLPRMGNDFSSAVTRNMLSIFPSIKHIIVCGIAGGVPEKVRLGDIVVSTEGIIEYDYGKATTEGIKPKESGCPCGEYLIEAVKHLEANEIIEGTMWRNNHETMIKRLKMNYTRPKKKMEKPYLKDGKGNYVPTNRKVSPNVQIHYGKMASGNSVLKDPKLRDELSAKYDIIGVEMESGGVNHATRLSQNGYLAVRGICDYCDESKDDIWQEYAAGVAAAYTITLIQSINKKV